MRKYKDLTGQVFNRLTVIERDLTRTRVYWGCKCDCGTIKSVSSANLKTGNVKSCGCLVKEKNNDGNYEPGNLRWATAEEQSQNTRSNVVDIVIVKQIRELKTTKTAKEISDIFDLKYNTVISILNNKSWKLEYE